MRRMLLLIPLLGLTACSRYEGPREIYQKRRAGDRADAAGYTIEEQKARGRERMTTFDDSREVGPKTYIDGPGGIGR